VGVEAFDLIHQAVYDGDDRKVVEIAEGLLAKGTDPVHLLNQGLIASLDRVGKDFADGLLFLPEVMLSAHAIHRGMRLLEPLLAEAGVEPRGSVLIGTVKSDQHDIGKNIVAMMLRGAGFRVKDLGIDVDPEVFVEAAGDGTFQVVAMSALLTTSLPWLEKTIQALDNEGIRNRVKVLVGGAVLDADKALAAGADGYAPDAARAVYTCKELLGLATNSPREQDET
jgi:5-methyltetrahydrofolate--homocysteine methyltransferase